MRASSTSPAANRASPHQQASGLFDEARTALEFLARTSDASGKVVHEITTSGAAHYDAADATPLFLRFVAAYAEWTGDLATIRAHWAEVRAAVSCVLSHDRDHDGLPENTGVGHGWIESGALGGGALTAYTASIWIDALTRLAPVATWVGDDDLATRLGEVHQQAAGSFERRLRDRTTGRIFLHLDREGRPMREVTALSAVPIALGVDRHAASDAVLDLLGSDRFSTPWGVRMMDREDARYDPAGYHVGAVWPLFTGWVALANFARRRPESGWRHLQANVASMFTGARGAFPEVLRGDDGRAAGVCPDQAWSAAMVISPFISGLLGMRPSAPTHSCMVDPRWPPTWSSASVAQLRVGRSVFALSMHRGPTAESANGPLSYHYALQLSEGVPLEVRLGREPEGVTVRLEVGRVVTVVQSAGLPGHAPTLEDNHGRS